MYKVQSWHYDVRKSKNVIQPRTYNEAMKIEGADDSISAAAHQFTAKDGPNIKVCWDDGSEAIYDSDGNIVTNAKDMGTYNYFVPTDTWSSIMHLGVDFLPWVIFGNSDDDPGPVLNYAQLGFERFITLFE